MESSFEDLFTPEACERMQTRGCCAHRQHHPLFCVMPPHILESIALKGRTEQQRSRALQNLSVSNSLQVSRTGSDEANRAQRQQARARRLLEPVSPTAGQAQRTIYSANNTQRLPGTRVDPTTSADPAVTEAYTYMGDTYNMYWQIFGRDSIDNNGMVMQGSVHYGKEYDNAFWDGQRMIYGDGDGQQFQRFTRSVDVIGHELTHGVTQNEAGLIYWKQTGALNESISDVFGSLVRQFTFNQTAAQADWLIGAELLMPSVHGVAIRSMKAPGTAYNDPVLGKDPQPANMRYYVETIQDSGGVHINSGIPNLAFYLVATYLGGYSWEKAGLIWYKTLLDPRLSQFAKFQDFANLTILVAQQLYPDPNCQEVLAVRQGWAEVGIFV